MYTTHTPNTQLTEPHHPQENLKSAHTFNGTSTIVALAAHASVMAPLADTLEITLQHHAALGHTHECPSHGKAHNLGQQTHRNNLHGPYLMFRLLHSEPGSSSSGGVVVRCEARHSKESGIHRKAEDFTQVRKALHLCVWARVMLTQNKLWDVSTLPFGLMNGARGVVAAVLYAPPGTERTDSIDLAGSTKIVFLTKGNSCCCVKRT